MARWVQYGPYGWVRVNGVEGVPVVYAHTRAREDQAGRRVISRLLFSLDPWESVTSTTLKTFPIGWLESMVNTPSALKELAKRDSADPKDDPASMALHELGGKFLFGDLPHAREADVARLGRPDGSDPDAFYRQVAERYLAVLMESRSIAPVLAEETGAPIPTVHRWIAEARRRGHLPPARKGRAG